MSIVSWLDLHQERRVTVVGSSRLSTFDDMAVEGNLTVHDRGFDEKVDTYREHIMRSGNIWSPELPNAEPLRLQCQHGTEA